MSKKFLYSIIAIFLIIITVLYNQIRINKNRIKKLQQMHSEQNSKLQQMHSEQNSYSTQHFKKSLKQIENQILTIEAATNNRLNKPILKIKTINTLADNDPDPKNIRLISEILKERYYIQAAVDNFDMVIVYDNGTNIIDQVDPHHKAIRLFITAEAIRPDLDKYDLAIGFDYIDDRRYLRIPYMYVDGNKISTKFNRGRCNPQKENFACFLVSNSGLPDKNGFRYWHNEYDLDGCAARNSLFHNLSKYKKVLSGGKYLNNIDRIISYEETQKWLSNCKFIIAYENQSYPGYITEKPFQAYMAGAIPLYYADRTVFADINPKSVIFARDFDTEEKFIDYIKKVDNNDELYCKIWNEQMMIHPELDFEVLHNKLRVKLNQLLDQRFNKN